MAKNMIVEIGKEYVVGLFKPKVMKLCWIKGDEHFFMGIDGFSSGLHGQGELNKFVKQITVASA